ncbi:MAG: hypothetical protein LUE98_08015 [Tannerellaceae bacterium]|nr:hypothetical protein [Tannerellaceae bacterium]
MEEKTFKERVAEFWSRFVAEEANLRKTMDEKKGTPEILKPFQELLPIAFNNPYYNVGVNTDGRYELILTPEGDPMTYYMTWYWLQQVPESLAEHWNFFASKPAASNAANFGIQMHGTNINVTDLMLYAEKDSDRHVIDIEIYAPKLASLADNQKYSLFFILLDMNISELYTMNYIGDIDFLEEPKTDGDELLLTELKTYIEKFMEEEGLQISDDPHQGFSVYELQIEEPQILREDIYIGNTANTRWINDYYNGDSKSVDSADANGVVWGFLFYDNTELEQDELINFRSAIEEAYEKLFEEDLIGMHVGSATGGSYSYLDFVIFDIHAFLAASSEIAEKYKLKDCGFSTFKKEGDVIGFTE